MTRGIVAVVTGPCCILALLLVVDAAVPVLMPGPFRGPLGGGAVGPLLLTMAYLGAGTALGGYVTARVAAR